ncbi:hypothetical protein CNMCM5793_000030 [Aspergillus hiratsukae]|uniref:DUF1996 domain-containing protein n=1 Tax=Aspergillus hiratsukae TaxID=1194566 RepID=A0A8H6UNG8_9EURO|nr:hypothetical protein CNMCM5793_000030 [Aspergillus hiratsukae]KAF7160872.1 hypothetical protein CNMCM6106_008233 [Aspergillus hiratsukae]
MYFIALLAAAGLAHAYTVVVAEQFMLKNIDPIVLPGQYKSHMHSFFGSDAVTINTNTSAELQAGCSTNENPNDLSVYWIPTLYLTENGKHTPITPMRFSAYYVNIGDAEIPFPQNFKAVAGNAKGASQADVEKVYGIQWMCEGVSNTDGGKDVAAFPTKTCPTHLQSILLFPDCVNPDTLEYAYSGTQNWSGSFRPANRCPAGMKRVPQLRFSIRYDLRKLLPDGWSGTPPLELACGSSYCWHGDFINGWVPGAAENMLKATDKREFMQIDGPLGGGKDGSKCGAKNAKDQDPNHGTSDYETSVKMMSSKRSIGQRR